MRRFLMPTLLAGVLSLGGATGVSAQDSDFLSVGEMVPDFEIPGATRYGVLAEPARLSDYRGNTVVLAYFFRVRTRG